MWPPLATRSTLSATATTVCGTGSPPGACGTACTCCPHAVRKPADPVPCAAPAEWAPVLDATHVAQANGSHRSRFSVRVREAGATVPPSKSAPGTIFGMGLVQV